MTLTSFQTPDPNLQVEVEILQHTTVTGGKDVFAGEKHTISHRDYLVLLESGKCKRVAAAHPEVKQQQPDVKDREEKKAVDKRKAAPNLDDKQTKIVDDTEKK